MKEKLLIMGIDTATKFILDEAKKKGIYTILTDYKPVGEVPLKQEADEGWILNVGDIDGLERKCRENGVTAVMAGNHEFCLDSTRKLARRLGLPFYADDFCWQAARDKIFFKQICRENGIGVAEDYKPGEVIHYPVIVKPSDSSAMRGISLVYEEKELKAAYDKALSFSDNKKIIIEQYLIGQEIMIVGYADNGEYHFLFVGEACKVPCNGKLCVSTSVHSPARTIELLNNFGDDLKKLLQNMGHRNGLFMLQGFVCEDGRLYMLEAGIRFDGVMTSMLAGKILGISPVSWMIDLALGVTPVIDWNGVDITSVDKYFGIYCIYSRPGEVKAIEGIEEIERIPGIRIVLNRFSVGDRIEDVGNMTQCAFYLQIMADTTEEFIRKFHTINSTLRLVGTDDHSLLIYEKDYDRIRNSLN